MFESFPMSNDSNKTYGQPDYRNGPQCRRTRRGHVGGLNFAYGTDTEGLEKVYEQHRGIFDAIVLRLLHTVKVIRRWMCRDYSTPTKVVFDVE